MNKKLEDFPEIAVTVTMAEEKVVINLIPDETGKLVSTSNLTEVDETSSFTEILGLIILNSIEQLEIQVHFKEDTQSSFEDILNNYSLNGNTPPAEA